jgi:hypothetical protein
MGRRHRNQEHVQNKLYKNKGQTHNIRNRTKKPKQGKVSTERE